MKAHQIDLRVFCTPEDDRQKLEQCFLELFPFDLKQEKLKLKKKNALGFNKRKIVIIKLSLKKQKHINSFLQHLVRRMEKKARERLAREASKLIDDKLCLYIRFDKHKLVLENRLACSQGGDCIHLTIRLSAFPRNRQQVVANAYAIFMQGETLNN